MEFALFEQFSRGKAINGYTEDRIVQSGNFFGILDGSRGPGYGGSDVITAMLEQAKVHIEQLPAQCNLEQLVDSLTAMAAAQKEKANLEDPRLTGGYVFCLYSRSHGEIWRVGDCKFRQAGKTHSQFWETEEICAQARAMMLQSRLNQGQSEQEIMASPDYDHLIDELLMCEASFLNRQDNPRSFGAINGMPVPSCYIERYAVQPGRLVITSDGYPKPCDTLAQSEQILADLLTRDPLCISVNLQCKGLGPNRLSFDDRAFVSAEIKP